MKGNLFFIALLVLLAQCKDILTDKEKITIPYGKNKPKGSYITVDSAKLYYESYGTGQPMIIIPGNNGTIESMKHQIDYFSTKYTVFIMDSRGRGQSEMGKDSLTYEQMSKDILALMNDRKIDSAYFFGYSDGGITALLIGISHPEKVIKLATFGANISPDSTAVYTDVCNKIKAERIHAEQMLLKNDNSKDWTSLMHRYRLMEFQPNIPPSELTKIKDPVLVMSADQDIIREEHTILLHHSIKNSYLCIFPGEKHNMINTNHSLLNRTINKFFLLPIDADKKRI